MEQDDTATQPPADEPAGDTPAESGEQPSEDPAEGPGPRGNPEVDEESLRHKQEEQDSVAGN